ncbi:MAG: transposase [Verrucomicrobiales bacterium]
MDRSRKIARLHRAGELEGIHCARSLADSRSEAETDCPQGSPQGAAGINAVRDLCRARTDAMQALARAKQQLGMFLLRNGVAYPGKTRWTQAHMNYLRRTRLPHPAHQLVLEEWERLAGADMDSRRLPEGRGAAGRRRSQYIRVRRRRRRARRPHRGAHERYFETWERRPYVEALVAFRGFQTVAAMTAVSELGDPYRFAHPRQLMGYLGLVPGEDPWRRAAGDRSLKTGNLLHARWMLIECASHYSHPPRVSPQPSARHREGQSREVRAIAWRAQHRLNRSSADTRPPPAPQQATVVAVARELCGYSPGSLHRQVASEIAAKAAA